MSSPRSACRVPFTRMSSLNLVRLSSTVGLLAVASVFLCVPTNGQNQYARPASAKARVWKIAFERTSPQGGYAGGLPATDVYVVYSDGHGLRRMTRDGRSHAPAWSPNGSRLLILHRKVDSPALYRASTGRLAFDTDISILESEGGEPVEQSLGPGFIPQAAWLPDGRSVAVDFRPAPRRAWDKTGIYALELDRDDPPPLLIRDAYHFAWSPDGKSVAYVASRGKKDHPAIFVSLADGSGEHRLTDPELRADEPAWSPDGKRIALAVEHGTHSTPQGLYLMNGDGSELKSLSGKKDHVQSPVWSPDGKRVAFLIGKNSDSQLFVVDADGSNLRQLTNEKKLYCRKPTWSPDSAEVAFECGPHFDRYYYYDPFWPFWWGSGPRVPETDIYLLHLDAPDAKAVQISRGGGGNPAFCPSAVSRDDSRER